MTAHQTKRAMNLAIDRLLTDEERGELHAHLDRTPSDARLWARMQRADRLLKAAPTLHAPEGFADRFMAALSSGRQPLIDSRLGLGIAFGLLAAALAVIPVFGLAVIGIVAVASDPVASAGVLAQINGLFGQMVASATALTAPLVEFLHTQPMSILVAALSIPVLALWSWLLHASEQGRIVTYRIPVRAT